MSDNYTNSGKLAKGEEMEINLNVKKNVFICALPNCTSNRIAHAYIGCYKATYLTDFTVISPIFKKFP